MKIIAVFKTHFDIGYTRLRSDVIAQYSGKMLDDVIAACETTAPLGAGRRYVWTMPGWPLQITLDNAAPDKRARAEALIRCGQLVPHGLPFTTHTELLTRDELQYGCLITKRLCRKYGVRPPVSAKMTDVPGHTAGLIDVLVENGIKFVHFGCNPASKPPEVPLLFWWEDNAGKRVLVMYNSDYGSTLLPPAGWNYPVWLAMQQTYDNVGPQGPEVIEALEKQVGEADALTVGTMDDFYHEIVKCDLSDLPVFRGELGDTWIHGGGTYPVETAKLRRARDKVYAVRARLDPADLRTKALLETYYENMLLFGEHTFGLDVRVYLGDNRRFDKAGFTAQRGEERFRLMEKSWDEKRAVARKAIEAADLLYEKAAIRTPPQPTGESPFRADVADGEIVVTMPDGTAVKPRYDYRLISFWSMNEYLRSYLQRMCHWGMSDFGRDGHPETEGKLYAGTIADVKRDGNKLVVAYAADPESAAAFGNAPKYTVTVTCEADRARVRLALEGKEATQRLEALNMRFAVDTAGERYLVTKTGQEIDPAADVIRGANSVLFACENYAAVDEVAVRSIDAPLVTFGDNGIFEQNLSPFAKPQTPAVTFNLFNNQWGTNFPLYAEGDMAFEFEIMPLETARKTLPLHKTTDCILQD